MNWILSALFDFKYLLISFGIGYFIGAIPYGVLIAKSQGVDILKCGSRSPGATNVKRMVGKHWGNLVFFLDFCKGWAAVMCIRFLAVVYGSKACQDYYGALMLACLSGAIIGHCYSIFIGGKGGKGVATLMGGLLTLMPLQLMIGLVIWISVFYALRYVSLASIAFALSLPITSIVTSQPKIFLAFNLIACISIIWLHRSNIRRLIQGTEYQFVRKGLDTHSCK